MKSFFLMVLIVFSGLISFGQLKATKICPPFEIDILAGTVNGLFPKSAIGEIEEALPCYSDLRIKDTDSTCGGVFYKEYDVSFYTDRRYVEIGEKVKAKMVPALMGASRASLFGTLGHPKIKDITWDAFQMGYGTLVLYYNKAGNINKIQIANRSTDALKLCE